MKLDVPVLPQTIPSASLNIQSVNLPSNKSKIYIRLYTNVINAKQILEKIKKPSSLSEDGTMKMDFPNCLILDATMVYDLSQVVFACTRAEFLNEQGNMKTRTLYTEMIYNMSPETKIGETIKVFGLKESSKELLVVVLLTGDEEGSQEEDEKGLDAQFDGLIQGESQQDIPSKLKEIRNMDAIAKV